MKPEDREKLDMQARAQQMKINTRLTALQSAMGIISTKGYLELDGGKPTNKVDHITVIAMATDIEKYILGEIEQETKAALDALDKPKPTIVPAKEMPASKFRP